MGNVRAKKVREKILAVLLAVTVVVGFVAGNAGDGRRAELCLCGYE